MTPLAVVERAITVRQPYAQCMALGHKLIENRPRPTRHRGPIAIHAAKLVHPRGSTDPRVIAELGADPAGGTPRGAVIGAATLVDCHPAEQRGPGRTCCEPWGDAVYITEAGVGPAFHLVLADAVLLVEPVPARGSLTVGWLLPEGVRDRVRAGLAEAVTR